MTSAEGEGGGYPNSDGRRGRLSDRYSNNSDKGGEGVKNPENLADVICEWPLTSSILNSALPISICGVPGTIID